MLESIINLVPSGVADSHTPQTAVTAVLCTAMIRLFSWDSLFMPDTEKAMGLTRRDQRRIGHHAQVPDAA